MIAINPESTSKAPGYEEALSKLIDIEVARDFPNNVHRHVLTGLGVDSIRHLQEAGVNRAILDFIVKPRTLDHRKKKGERLSPEESDKVYRVSHLLALADKVFGSHEKAMRWLNKPKQHFDGATPLDMAMTSQGTALVEEMLYGIDHGFFA